MKSVIQVLVVILLLLAIWTWPTHIGTPPPANAVTSVENFSTAEALVNKFPKELGDYRKAIKETTLTNADFARMQKDANTLEEEISTREHTKDLKEMRESGFPGPMVAWFTEHLFDFVPLLLVFMGVFGFSIYRKVSDY